jgi:hypothetical protein
MTKHKVSDAQASRFASIGRGSVRVDDPPQVRGTHRPRAAHGDRADNDGDEEHERLLTAAQVKRRFGDASDMWLWRRLHDSSGFPQPLFICARRFWKLSELIAWERARAKGAA